MPAELSSPIPTLLAHLTRADPLQLPDAAAPHLLTYLAAVPDPRAARGRRHPLVAILAMAAAEATIRRTLSGLDADALAAAVGAWLAERDRERPRPAASPRRAVAVDGKTLRGAPGQPPTAARRTCWPA